MRLARLGRGLAGCGRMVTRQAEREVAPERAREGTPQPSIPHRGEALGQPVRQDASDTRLGREGHGVPAMLPGGPRATADLARVDGE